MKPLHLVALTIGAIASIAMIVFAGIELFTDPGGIRATLILIAWLAMLFMLTVFASVSPRATLVFLILLIGGAVIFSLSSILTADAVNRFIVNYGPGQQLMMLLVLVPLVALGRTLPRIAGWLMVCAGAGIFGLLSISLLFADDSSKILGLAITTAPFLLCGGLLILVARMQRDTATPVAA
jgi:hypothetical protein